MERCASGYMLENPVYLALPRNVRQGVYHGDNVTSAENQQERLIEFRGWVIGFVDGEGCFSIGFVRQPSRPNRVGYKTGVQVTRGFTVTQACRAWSCLEDPQGLLRSWADLHQPAVRQPQGAPGSAHRGKSISARWRRSSRSSNGIRFGARSVKTSRSSCDVSSSLPAIHTERRPVSSKSLRSLKR